MNDNKNYETTLSILNMWYLKITILAFIGVKVFIYLLQFKFFAYLFLTFWIGFLVWLISTGGNGDDPGGAGSTGY